MLHSEQCIAISFIVFSLNLPTMALSDEMSFSDAFAVSSESSAFGAEESSASTTEKQQPSAISKTNDALKALAAMTSFPMRLVYGENDSDSWEKLPDAAMHPKELVRWYSVKGCNFAMSAKTFGVNITEENIKQIGHKESIGPQTVVYVDEPSQITLSISTELQIVVEAGTEKACHNVFAGKKHRFGQIGLEGGQLFIENRQGERTFMEAIAAGQAKWVYLIWDEEENTLRVTDRAGLPVGIETPGHNLPWAREGVYYLSYEPKWTLELGAKKVAAK